MNQLSYLKKYSIYAILAFAFIFTSCDDDDETPPEENEVEVITNVTLIFTDATGGTVTATATDPDGAGVQELVVSGGIDLAANTTYTLTYEILNGLESPAEDIGEEIAEEDDEHQIFFGFSEGAFSDPSGNGNIDNSADPINYNDTDGNGNPVGLSTTWTTAGALSGGTFTVRLQHQPDIKTATSGANDGDTDFDLTFTLNIQ